MATYWGRRGANGPEVSIITREGDTPLSLRLDLAAISPDGFDWGDDGRGSQQLGIALLAGGLGDEFAEEHFLEFTSQIVTGLSYDTWSLCDEAIREWWQGVRRDDRQMEWQDGEVVESDRPFNVVHPRQLRDEQRWEIDE